MTSIQIVEVAHPITGEIVQHVIIDKGNNEFTSMLKSVWDELQAQQVANKSALEG